MDKCILEFVGKWIKQNKNFIYSVRSSDITAENAYILQGENGKYYAVIKDVNMSADVNVQLNGASKTVTLNTDKKIKKVVWLDNGELAKVDKNSFAVDNFKYGTSHSLRVAEITLK
jgi:hypothetical protein